VVTSVKLTTAKSIVNIILKGSEKVEINWGDGTIDTYKVPGTYSHNYHNNILPIDSRKIDPSPIKPKAYEIVITGDNITGLFCDDNELIDLEGKSASLEVLSCGSNNLSHLNVDGFGNLKNLACTKNQLSATALNKLFESLPKLARLASGELLIVGNPGTESCNTNIATEKGWTVDYNINKVMSLATTKSDVLFVLEGVGPIVVNWGDETSDPYGLPAKCFHSYKYFIRPIDEIRPIDKPGPIIERMVHDISVIRVSRTFSVTHVNCNDNQLISLEIDEKQLSSSIVSLSCSDNLLTSLSVNGLTNLVELDCRNNQLSAKALDKLFSSLPKISPKVSFGRLFIKGNPGVESCNTQIAIEKGWIVDFKPKRMVLVTKEDNVCFVWGGSDSVLVNWGDGTNNNYNAPEHKCTHRYNSAGDHIITIIGNAITSLDCSYNGLKSLDVSNNSVLEALWCDDNQLTSLEVNRNINLKTLECIKNSITALAVNMLAKLVTLNCGHNLLSILDVSNNLALETLSCGNNKLTHLVVCGFANLHTLSCENNELKSLYCYNNQLKTLDFSGNTELETLHCEGNKLESLDVGGLAKLKFLNCGNNELTGLINLINSETPVLEQLYCYGNKLTKLTVKEFVNLKILNCANNPLLTYLHCGHNWDEANPGGSGLASLDISNNTSLYRLICCCNVQLLSLDVSDCTNLMYLQAQANKLTSLDVSRLTKLIELNCSQNELTSLDVSNNTELTVLQCNANPIATIDTSNLKKLKRLDCAGILNINISENTALEYIHCAYSQLTSLNVDNHYALERLFCYSNNLTKLTVSNNKKIKKIACLYNSLETDELNELFKSLPDLGKDAADFTTWTADDLIAIVGNPGADSCDREIAKKKGWTVR
jgi:Leucine-rich repeat (LRR) protein